MKLLKSTAILVLVVFLAGCAKNIPLESSHAEQIKSTELIIVKKPETLEFPYRYPLPIVAFSPDPVTMLIGSGVATGLYRFVIVPRENNALASIKEDLRDHNIEDGFLKSLNGIVGNKHFKFTSVEIANVATDKDLPKIIQAANTEHVALLLPSYTVDYNIRKLIIECKVSLYNRISGKNKSKLPEPIYQTTVKYQYALPKGGWFSHVNNTKRWKADNGALMKKTLDEGVAQLSKDLIAKLEQPSIG